MRSIAFIGSVGIPNRYGGFESFLESVCPVIKKAQTRVIVTCDALQHSNKDPVFRGVERVFVPVKANGPLSPLHDFVAFLMVFWRVDTVCALGVSAGPFFFVMRLLASVIGKRLVINVDGVEWRRAKFSWFAKWVLRIFDASAQISAHKIIIDSPALLEFVFPMFREKAQYIPYSGDHVARNKTASSCEAGRCLTICRIEPENNLKILIEAVLASNASKYTIIGNWENSEFGRGLRKKHQHEEKLALLDPIYDSEKIAEFREACGIYLHGHSVGGTNPSLVEVLFYDCEILCYDCVFNRITAKDGAEFFKNEAELAQKINSIVAGTKYRKTPNLAQYTAARISEQYIAAAFEPEDDHPKPTWKEQALVFVASVVCVLVALLIERRVGIAWDFHPDAVTYMTTSKDRVAELLSSGPSLKVFINNGHYFLSALLLQNRLLVTGLNVFVFAVTNVIFFRLHKRVLPNLKGFVSFLLLAALLFNPYRVHLATTVLKDTLIIFFLVGVLCSRWAQLPFVGLLICWRQAALLYLTLRIPRKVLAALVFVCFAAAFLYWGRFSAFLLEYNNLNLSFRKFDMVPSLAKLGAVGIVLRVLLWPVVAISGAFFFFSPTLPFFPLFLGSVFALFYNYKVYRSFSVHWAVFLPIAFIAAVTPGFTTYYRYAFPMLVCLPLYLGRCEVRS